MLFLYLIVIAWLYVVVLMAASVATSPTGSVFAAIMTLFIYGLLPVALMVYLMTGKLRRKARLAAENLAQPTEPTDKGASPPPAPSSPNPNLESRAGSSPESSPDSNPATDAGRHAPAGAEHSPIAPVRKEP